MGKILKNTAILTAITLIAGLLLGLVYEITKEPIAASKEAAKQKAYQAVVKEAESFETVEVQKELIGVEGCTVEEVALAMKDEKTIGYVITSTSSEGYGGDIRVSVGMNAMGEITGVEVLSISETAGLGMNAQKEEFREQFVDKRVESFVVSKSAKAENEIDALSGATVTSEAFTNAVNASVSYFQQVFKVRGGTDE